MKFFLSAALALALSLVLPFSVSCTPAQSASSQPRVLLVTVDGLRWQEVFGGADEALLNKEHGGVPDASVPRARYGGDSPEERRAKLLPFLWGAVAREGQIYGNRPRGSRADVTNQRWFSYPGYNELLTGRADDARIVSNRPILNPNVSVLEWLQGRPGFGGKVFGCAAWQAFPAILNTERSRLPVWVAGVKSLPGPTIPALADLGRLVEDVPSPWPDEHYDAFVQRAALAAIEASQPRVLYVSFGETDEWAHARRYDNYLEAAHRVDRWVKELWDKLQSLPEYQGHTTLLLTTDHGRGTTPENWTDHGEKVPESGQVWMAALGPGVSALGERTQAPEVKQAQVAATVARLAGEDYPAQVPTAAPPVADMFPPGQP